MQIGTPQEHCLKYYFVFMKVWRGISVIIIDLAISKFDFSNR